MRKVLTPLLLLATGTGLFSSSVRRPEGDPEPALAIVDAVIVDGTVQEPFRGTVLIRGERIEAVGEDVEIPDDARVLDGSGHTLLPGLFDVHTHAPYSAGRYVDGDWRKNLLAYLYSGVTTIVDFGSFPETFQEMRRLIEEGLIEGPNLVLASRFAPPMGHGIWSRGGFTEIVLTASEVEPGLERLLPYRPDAVKVFADGWRYNTAPDLYSMRLETLKELVSQARRHRLPVLTHTVSVEEALNAALAGVDGIVHAVSDRPTDDRLVSMLRSAGTYYAPTMAVYEIRSPALDHPFLEKILEPVVRESFEVGENAAGVSLEVLRRRRERWSQLRKNSMRFHQAGVPFSLGTDAGISGTFHGWATLHELQLLVDLGMSPGEALKAGTLNAARMLGRDDLYGSVEAGKAADLILVEGEPHLRMEDIWKIRRVFKAGREIDRPALSEKILRRSRIPPESFRPQPLIDDFESPDGRAANGGLWWDNYESGHNGTRVLYGRLPRVQKGHSLLVQARMASLPRPFARMTVPLSRGAMKAADASHFDGIRFEVRGEGEYLLIVHTYGVRDGDEFQATFEGDRHWRTVFVPFSRLSRQDRDKLPSWTGRDLTAISFEMRGRPGETRRLELDNLQFFKAVAPEPR